MADWVEDDTMSADETMQRFEALNPVATAAPSSGGADAGFSIVRGLVKVRVSGNYRRPEPGVILEPSVRLS